jgi:hypothetical protein
MGLQVHTGVWRAVRQTSGKSPSKQGPDALFLTAVLCVGAQAVEPITIVDISTSLLIDKEGAKDVRSATCDGHASDSLMSAMMSLRSG